MHFIFILIMIACAALVMTGGPPHKSDSTDISAIRPEPVKVVTQPMDVQAAYDAIPHVRVTFDPQQSTMLANEATYLHQFFNLVDLAIVERVETWHYLSGKGGADNKNSMEILRQMQALPPPDKLRPVYEHVLLAIYEQKQLFDDWRQDKNFRMSADAAHVRSISSHLRQAYTLLMNLYPNETDHNKNAFYQYLCALDNI